METTDIYNLRRIVYLQDCELKKAESLILSQKAEIERLEGLLFDLQEQARVL